MIIDPLSEQQRREADAPHEVTSASNSGPEHHEGETNMSATLNGFRCDPATAEHVITDPGGDDRFGMYHALEGTLYRAPEGHWFVVRALTPDEAREWLEPQGDEVMLRRRFPDNA
jgi:hypothetical protein